MPKKEESYESMLNKLEEIVDEMDSKELPLNDAMKKYEDGIKLCNKLYSMLNKAEGKIKIINNGTEEDFSPEE